VLARRGRRHGQGFFMNKRRSVFYALAATALFAAEVCIALFAHDHFVRPDRGDVLAVVFLHCAVRVVFPQKPKWLALYVFLFACAVEALQGVHILRLLGLEQSRLLQIIVGTRFSWGDILCYLAGFLLIGGLELLYAYHIRPKPTNKK
jgi:hypothetical protein